MRQLRAAVIGAGHLGRFHAQKYAADDGVDLVAVVDPDQARAGEVARECATTAMTDHRNLLDSVDVVSIVVPAVSHFRIADAFLRGGVHVLVEKPIATNLADAQALIDSAAASGCVLQVGHLERFNPALGPMTGELHQPLFVECHRLIPFNSRGTDVDVVLDLMIHDLDIILELMGSEMTRVDACGVPVLTKGYDIVNARLRFENGCTVNVTASRVSQKRESRLRVFQHDTYFSVDLSNRKLEAYRRREQEDDSPYPELAREVHEFPPDDLLKREIEAFLGSVRNGAPVVVSGSDGLRALAAALRIRSSLAS